MTDPDVEGRRWPRSVFGSGEEPDPRFSLANERTFLAWLRTAVGFGAAGVALVSLDLHVHGIYARAAACLFIAAAVALPIAAWCRWQGMERALRHQRELRDGLLPFIVVLGVSCACVLVMVALIAA